jgi:mersacidin/lichenicidin family type 2 lantibiotic
MTRDQIIRAWKDEDFRRGLNASELAALPDHPAGAVDLTDAELGMVGALSGGWTPWVVVSAVTLALDCWKSLAFASCETGTKMCCPA